MNVTITETLGPVQLLHQIHLAPFPLLQLVSQCYVLIYNKIEQLRRIENSIN